jgi:hypothetical protein
MTEVAGDDETDETGKTAAEWCGSSIAFISTAGGRSSKPGSGRSGVARRSLNVCCALKRNEGPEGDIVDIVEM